MYFYTIFNFIIKHTCTCTWYKSSKYVMQGIIRSTIKVYHMVITCQFCNILNKHIKFTFWFKECPAGKYGDNCTVVCPPSSYGTLCLHKCDCLTCHHVYGCSSTPLTEGKILSACKKECNHSIEASFLLLHNYYWILSTNNMIC